MFPGFLPVTRPATFMFDFVVLAMIAIVPILTISVYMVVVRKQYEWHRRIQLGLAIVTLIAVILFEVDIRADRSWWDRAMQSPYAASGVLKPFLAIHLFFAVSTSILWIVTTIGAVRRFPVPARPTDYSRTHRLLGRLAAIDMACTSFTGWTFYYMAFIAR